VGCGIRVIEACRCDKDRLMEYWHVPAGKRWLIIRNDSNVKFTNIKGFHAGFWRLINLAPP